MEEDILLGIEITHNPINFVPTSFPIDIDQYPPLNIDSELTRDRISELMRSTTILPINSSVMDKKAILIDFIREMQVNNQLKLSTFQIIRNKIEELW